MSIKKNIELIREKIYNAAKRRGVNGQDIIIVCVTKNRIVEEIYEALDAGIEHLGESRIQEAQRKYSSLKDYANDINLPFSFHMIGHLQTNKVGKALDMFDMIQSVDSFRLACKINEKAREKSLTADVLVQVNVSGEETKYGLTCSQTIDLLKKISDLENISVRGLMTMAPLVDNQELARPYFVKLRQLRDRIGEIKDPWFRERIKMDFLSMGMSQDYEVAVEEGANMLRIGTAIFEGE